MTLGELIKTLEGAVACVGREHAVPHGLVSPHSYRGYYEDLAFEIGETTLGRMLDTAKGCVGQTFNGYKGGEYTADEYTSCWVAEWGCTGETLGMMSLSCMFNGCQPVPGVEADRG